MLSFLLANSLTLYEGRVSLKDLLRVGASVFHHIEGLIDFHSLQVQICEELWLNLEYILCCQADSPAEILESQGVVPLDVVELAEAASKMGRVWIHLDSFSVGFDCFIDLILLMLAVGHLGVG